MLCYSYPAFSYFQYGPRQMHSVQYKTLNTIHDVYQLPHVSASECHFQRVYQNKGTQVQHTISGTDRPHCYKILNNNNNNNNNKVDSASNRNEYQEYFLGGKGGRCVGLTTYHLHVTIVLKSGSLNLLQPSGPVQASNGVALPLLLLLLNTQG
jgi:hypothetical protein